MDDSRTMQATLNQLITAANESTKNFYSAAEQVENRAVKLLLKAYAQERARFVHELQQATAAANEVSESDYSGSFLQRGWMELRSALVIRRQRRQRVLIDGLQQAETNTLEAYAKAAAAELPVSVKEIVNRQYERVRLIHGRLKLLSRQHEQRLALRLFNQAQDAEQAITGLEKLGIPRSELTIIPIEDITFYMNDQNARPRATREAIMTGALLGFIVGGLLGLLYGVFNRLYFPEFNGFVATTPAGVMFEMSLYAGLIGALFSTIFSALIASSAAEIDAHLYEDSFENGNTLVAVFADASNITEIERTIGLKHEHEIEPVPA